MPYHDFKLKEDGPTYDGSELGRIAMCSDEKKGWILETLGPASRHWKRLAREVNSRVARDGESPTNVKHEGPIPLQKLDPNTCGLKHRKGNKRQNQNQNGEEQMDGGVAVAAKQHR